MKNKWLRYKVEIVGIKENSLKGKEESINSFANENGIAEWGIVDMTGNLVAMGEFVGSTRTEVKYKYKLLKGELKAFFNVKKLSDLVVAEGDCW